MKREALLRYLRAEGCTLAREGVRHSIWQTADGTKMQAIPRHSEIHEFLARAICRKLGLVDPGYKGQ